MLPHLYTELASWWPLLSPPDAYQEDALVVHTLLQRALGHAPRSLLELGCGSGTLASHLPDGCARVLNDLSPEMLTVAQQRNPTAETVVGDLRSLRLDRTFDAVLIHDAVMYLSSEADLAAAIQTARAHLAVGGVLLMMPDFITETFYEGTDAGGSDAPDGRAIRLMEWRWDPDPDDASFQVEMSLLLREQDGTVRAVHERHTMSLFSHATWWKHIRAAGLQPHDCTADLLGLELDSGVGELFVARRT